MFFPMFTETLATEWREIIMSKKYKVNDSIEINDLKDELVIIIPQTEKMFYFNKLARDILYFLRDGLNVEQIIDSMLVKYDVNQETLKLDIGEVLDQLVDFQIITLEEN